MEEYKRIARLVLVPSFFTLLLAFPVIILAYNFFLELKTNLIAGLFFLFLSISAPIFSVLYSRRSGKSFPAIVFSVVISFLIIMRILLLTGYTPVNENSNRFTAVVESVKALRYSNEINLNFTVSDIPVRADLSAGNKAVSYADKEIEINHGDVLEIHARPKKIKQGSMNISSFETHLLRKGFHYIFYLNSKNYKILKNAPVTLKNKIRKNIENNIRKLFDAKTVQLVKGLYFANCSYIEKSVAVEFKRAGALHLLAASGEHVGIVAAVLLLVLSPMLLNRKILRIIIALALLFYLYITDMPVSLLRAFVMYYVFSIQHLFDLEKNIFNTLFLSAIIILILNPYEIYNLGFQLSFGATFGILLFYNFYKEIFSPLPSRISAAISVTFSAQVFVLPVIFLRLREINLAGLFSNVVLVFTMAGTMMLSIAANLVSVIAFFPAKLLALLTDHLYFISLKLVQYFSGVNGHYSIDEGNGLIFLIPFLFFLVPAIPVKINRRIKSLSLFVAVLSAWIILGVFYSERKNRIIVAGTVSNIFILQNENTEPVLFGDLKDIGEADRIANYLNRHNIRNINLYIPKPDFYNLRCFTYLIKNTIVSKCHITSEYMFSGYFRKFCRILDADGIRLAIDDFNTKSKPLVNAGDGPGILKGILLSPVENINVIYLLFSGEHGLNNVMAEEIINCGYNVDYLE